MAEENTNIQHLLYQVSAINKKYEQIAEITGENFNVFKILGLTTNEVRTHSAFIAELLNPKGSHGCKDTFLKLFIERLQESIKEQAKGTNENGNQILERIKKFICSDKCKASVEYYIGEINEDRTVGGRIDILLRDQKKNEIIIENKIYAGEQTNQLIRYSNYNKSAPIIYLTLKGDKPTSAKSLYEFNDFLCISYKDDILNWLNECLKITVSKPILRETIVQYLNLIKHLTDQTINNDREKEMINKIIDNKDYIEAAIEIANNIDKIKNAIFSSFFDSLNKKGEEKKLDIKSHNEESIRFGIPNLIKYTILLERGEDPNVLNFGIYRLDGEPYNEEDSLRNKVESQIGKSICSQGPYKNWLWWKDFEFEFEDLISKSFIDEKLNDVIEILQKLEGLNQVQNS